MYPTKSVINPTQRLIFWAFLLDSIYMDVSPTLGKIQKTITACEKMQNEQHPIISEVAKVIGIVGYNFPGAHYGTLHYSSFEHDKTEALAKNWGDYKSHIVQVSNACRAKLRWWVDNMGRDIILLDIQKDASKKRVRQLLAARKLEEGVQIRLLLTI